MTEPSIPDSSEADLYTILHDEKKSLSVYDLNDLYPKLEELLERHRQAAVDKLADSIFIDIPTGWEVTKLVKTHEIDCSWEQEQMLCDCSVLKGAQLAVDKAKERLLLNSKRTGEGKG